MDEFQDFKIIFNSKHKQADELKDFRLKPSSYNRVPKNETPGRWIPPGEVIKVGDLEITGGNFYFGGILKSLDKQCREASLVDEMLPVDFNNPDYSGKNMGYWPRYCDINPKCRAGYLNWLSGNRDQAEINIGFIFLYFYGIERRLLIDNIGYEEYQGLKKELFRLKEVYGYHPSFVKYCETLMSHAAAVHMDKDIEDELLTGDKKVSNALLYRIGTMVRADEAIDSKTALLWAKSHPVVTFRTPAKRCKREFDTLFEIIFNRIYPKGLKVTLIKSILYLGYTPASSSLKNYQKVKFDLPDPGRLKAPVNRINEIVEETTKKLEPLSRYFLKHKGERESENYIVHLPEELKKHKREREFKLNPHLLKKHESETRDVHKILDSIFVDESGFEHEKEVVSEVKNIGLDNEHFQLYNELITREEWDPSEVSEICNKYNLMVDGAVEVINDWAYDLVDAPLIEDGSTFFIDLDVNSEILEALEGE